MKKLKNHPVRILGLSNTALIISILLVIVLVLGIAFYTQIRTSPTVDTDVADAVDAELTVGDVDDERIKRALIDEPGSWLSYGQSYEERRFSDLDQINRDTVSNLGLVWYHDIDQRHRLQGTPLVVDGVMYYTDSWSVVFAVDAATGEEVWTFDPQTRREFIRYSCCGGPLNRGVAVHGGKVYVATFDARLLAIDAATGEKIWDVDTLDEGSLSKFNITAAPRVASGKVYIGQSSSEFGIRGYVTAYDADTGEQAWRFWLVPGDPSKGFEHPELEMAAETWDGQWWEFGGGGTVWNSIVYDQDFHTLYLGVGNGAPWSRDIRSPGGGDNLFLTAIVAVDPDTGRMKWYYQTVPGDNWDYSAAMDIALAEMEIDGEMKKVLVQAPKNGYFYVIDREDGSLLRADPYSEITWAVGMDMETGRPIENPNARFEQEPQWILPGNGGAHNWQAMSVDQSRNVAYIPTHDNSFFYALPEIFVNEGIYRINWGRMNLGVASGEYRQELIENAAPRPEPQAHLKAFDYSTGEILWVIKNRSTYNGGTLATAGGLVFQGDGEGLISAYNTDNGEIMWEYESYSRIGAPPITYQIDGTQYIAIQVGAHGRYDGGGRQLVFALNGEVELPAAQERNLIIPEQTARNASAEELSRGNEVYHEVCANCHGGLVRGGTMAADLRLMTADTHQNFQAIVRGGIYQSRGMENFSDLVSAGDAERVHQYIISRATIDREAQQVQ